MPNAVNLEIYYKPEDIISQEEIGSNGVHIATMNVMVKDYNIDIPVWLEAVKRLKNEIDFDPLLKIGIWLF